MALDNYANLKAAVENWSHRKDVKDYIDDFIAIAETEFYNGVYNPDIRESLALRVREMEALDTSTTSTSSRFLALPTDYLELRRLDLTVSSVRKPLQYRTPNQLIILDGTAAPSYYTITDQVEFDITPDDTYSSNMQYFKKFDALDATNNTNDILTNYPNVYLYGALWALFQYARNTEEETKYFIKFTQAIESANNGSYRGRYGKGLSARVRGSTP